MAYPEHVPNNPRTAIIWPETSTELLTFLSGHPGLQRVYLLSDQPSKSVSDDPRVIPLAFSTPETFIQELSVITHNDALYFVEGRYFCHIATCHLEKYPALQQQIDQTVLDNIRRLVAIAALRAYRGWHMLANICLNTARIRVEPTIGELGNKAVDATVVVVGAGPSLDDNIHQLAHKRDRVFVVACDGAWKSLTCAGITPDLVVTTDDSEKVWRYFEHAQSASSLPIVACLHQTSWPVVRHYPGRLLFGKTKMICAAIEQWFPDLPEWDTGLCVGHAALECAYLMNPAQIILIGFDLGYKQNVFHPKNMPMPYFHHNPPPTENLTTVPGIDGTAIRTDLSMAFYLKEFITRIAQHDTPVWDATEGGARIDGTRIISLAEALAICPVPAEGLKPLCFPARKEPTPDPLPTIHQAATALIEDLVRNTAKPIQLTPSQTPLEYLIPHQDTVDLLALAQNPIQHARLKFTWAAWLQDPENPGLKQQVMQEIQTHVSDLFVLAEMTKTLTAMPPPTAKPVNLNAMLYATAPEDEKRLSPLFSGLQRIVATWRTSQAGSTGNLVEIWQELLDNTIHLVISINGNLMPAAWGMPGCQCLDFRTTAPDNTLLHEQWIPGYAVLANQPDIATAWRNILPADQPVYRISEHACYRLSKDNKEEPITWEQIVRLFT